MLTVRRGLRKAEATYHSKSLYMIVKNTCRNRFTAFINTANRYNHASPDILTAVYGTDGTDGMVGEGYRTGDRCVTEREQRANLARDNRCWYYCRKKEG